jgi:peptide/nickel transport system substrate-binding protein
VTYYYDNLEAYRSDRFTGFVGQPEGSGSLLFQYGVYSYANVAPVSDDNGGDTTASPSPGASESADASGGTAEPTSGGSNTGLIIGLVIAALVIVGLVVALVRMRSKSQEGDRE